MRNNSAESRLSMQSDYEDNLDEYYKEKLPDVVGAIKRKVRNGCGKKLLYKRLPILNWLPYYQPKFLIKDAIAGFTVGLTAIPQGIAYAVIAGLQPQYGLYSDFMGSFVYIFLGTCKDITIGPTAIMALMVQKFTVYSPDFAILATFLTGCIIALFGFLNLGFLVRFISTPVTAGFTTAAALTIGSGQINSLFGIASKSNEFLDSWENLFTNISQIRPWDATLGIITFIYLIILRGLGSYGGRFRVVRKYLSLSRNAQAVIIGAIIAYICESKGEHPFKLTGTLEPGLPEVKLPPFHTAINNGTQPIGFTEMINILGTTIIALPLVSTLEIIAIAKTFSKGKTVDASQEMIALGMCNLLGSFVGSMPTTGSFSRTAINNASGVRTTLGGIVTVGLVLMALGLLTNAFYYIPKAALAAIIIAAMIYTIPYKKVYDIWKAKKMDLIPYIITVAVCIFVGLEVGIVAGIGVNLLFILYNTAKPQIKFELEKMLGYEVLIVTPSQSLVYLSSDHLKQKILKFIRRMGPGTKHVVINGELILSIDSTVAMNLLSIYEDLRLVNCEIVFWNWKKEAAGVAWRLSKEFGKHFQSSVDVSDVIVKQIEKKAIAISTETLT